MTKKTGLGKGLDALFSTPVIEEEKNTEEIAKMLKINEIEPNKEQARKQFDDEALEAIVDKAIERKTGARGLRAILEETMRDVMFDIPTNKNIVECIITRDTVEKGEEPKLVLNEVKKANKRATKTSKSKGNVESAS